MGHLYFKRYLSNQSGFKVAGRSNPPAGHYPVGQPWSRFRFGGAYASYHQAGRNPVYPSTRPTHRPMAIRSHNRIQYPVRLSAVHRAMGPAGAEGQEQGRRRAIGRTATTAGIAPLERRRMRRAGAVNRKAPAGAAGRGKSTSPETAGSTNVVVRIP
jgi:hypothetical protein